VAPPQNNTSQSINGLLHDFLSAFKLQLADELPHVQEALLKNAGSTFMDNTARLKEWMSQVASGALSQEDLAFLIKAQMDLSRMNALKEVGLTLARIDALRKSMTSTLISSLFNTIGL